MGGVTRKTNLSSGFRVQAEPAGRLSSGALAAAWPRALLVLLTVCAFALAEPSDCDLVKDSFVDCSDLAQLASWWLSPCDAGRCDGSDVNGDGSVDSRDFALLADHWRTVVLPDSIGFWKFDEGSGSIAFDSAGTHNGTIANASWQDGMQGWSLDFNGSGRYVTVSPAALGPLTRSDCVTVSFWQFGDVDMPSNSTAFQATYSSNPDNRVIGAQVAWYGVIYWDTVYNGQWDRLSKAADPSEYSGQWNHWAFTKDAVSGQMSIYLNGSLWAYATGKHNPLPAATRFTIGANIEGNENCGGRIDEFRLFDRCLRQDQVAALYALDYRQPTGFHQWAIESLARIDRDLRKSGSYLYAEYADISGQKSQTAYLWPQGIMFHALNNAAEVDPAAYMGKVKAFADELHSAYWSYKNGRWGYDSGTNGGTRFYDDNAWIAMAWMKLYNLTRSSVYLQRARDTMAFVMSGENNSPHSGIAWDEGSTGTSVCSTAPAIVANLLIYEATSINSYLADAIGLYDWISSPSIGIQDTATGLYHQGCDEDLDVNWGYRAYQTAVPLRACLLLYEILGDDAYLVEAQRLGDSMANKWINRMGAIMETAQWGGFDMVEAYVDLYRVDSDSRWLYSARKALEFLHNNSRDPNGRYPENWDTVQAGELQRFHLLYQAPAATGYWRVAGAIDQ